MREKIMKPIWNRQVLIALSVAAGIVCLFGGTAQAQDEGGGVRPPNIIENQFATTTNGSLQARRPGLWIQAGIAGTQGGIVPPGVEPPIEDSFVRESAALIMQSVFDSIIGLMDTLTLGASFGIFDGFFNTLSGLFGGAPPESATIPNPTTAGSGTTTPIP